MRYTMQNVLNDVLLHTDRYESGLSFWIVKTWLLQISSSKCVRDHHPFSTYGTLPENLAVLSLCYAHVTAQKIKFSIEDFFSKCNQIRSFRSAQIYWKTSLFMQCICVRIESKQCLPFGKFCARTKLKISYGFSKATETESLPLFSATMA